MGTILLILKWTPLCAEDLDVVINTYDMWFKINATNMNNIAENNWAIP